MDRPKIIAVDFDGTLCENMWPGIGAENTPIIKELIERKEDGDKVILYTCRTGNLLDAAVLWCKARGLEFDAVNENLPEQIAFYGGDCRKISADEYWDDKSVIVRATDAKYIAYAENDDGICVSRGTHSNIKFRYSELKGK